jgi:uncharacterized OB-fold protein
VRRVKKSVDHRSEHLRDALAGDGDMPTQGLYTAGIAGEKFLRAIKDDGRFLGSVCMDCDLVYVPPRLYCECCFAYLDDWIEVLPTGRVHTFTVVHIDLDGRPLPEPRVMAFVQLDGADGGLIHFLDEVDPACVCIGMPVEAVFKEKAERRGSILDIGDFRPVYPFESVGGGR